MPMIHAIVRHYPPQLFCGMGIEPADLVQEGAVALLAALNRYNPSKGASFRTFAYPCVRGAILDFIRNNQITPRSIHPQKRKINGILDRYAQIHERVPTADEFCTELSITPTEWNRLRCDLYSLEGPVGLDTPINPRERSADAEGHLTVADAYLHEPSRVEEIIERMETIEEVRAALNQLSPEGQVAVMRKFHGVQLIRETAEQLGVGESVVPRLRRQGMRQIKAALADFEAIDVR